MWLRTWRACSASNFWRASSLGASRARRYAASGALDLAVHALERGGHRLEQILDSRLARVDVRGGLGPRVAQPGFGKHEKRFVVRFERVGAERLKRLAESSFGALIGLQSLRVHGAIFVDLGLEAGRRGARGPPARARPA